MHAKTDSEVTSLAPSSPDHTRRPVYYVQSPSRDSHDGEKTTSFHSTPILSPVGSPPHSHSNSSVGHHSRESSSSRFSGSRKISPSANAAAKGGGKGLVGKKNVKEYDVIEEEGLLEDEEYSKPLPRRCYFLAFVVGFFVLFSFFALILWGASRPQKPQITMRSMKFDRFAIQAGSDNTGVSTDMISLNATVKFLYRNTATFFGVHVTSSPVDLSFSELIIGSGSVNKFYQSRKSQRVVAVSVIGDKIPMYGSGAGLSTPSTTKGTTPVQPVPLKLSFMLKSRAYVLGKLVKPKFYKTIDCSINLNPQKLNVAILLKNCTYS